MTHPQDLSLREQARAVRDADLDALELLDQTFKRLAQRDHLINSTPVRFEEMSRAMLANAPRGPLYGVPVTVKDMFALPWRGARNATPFELIPASASGPFRRLRDAGAVVVGVANQHELGMGTTGTASVYGAMANPWKLDHCAGGSSGGSAAAVSARLVGASLASDTGGSTRLPSAYCGVVGLKFTYGAVPTDGYFGASTTFSSPGVVTRDGADARLVAQAMLARVLARDDARDVRVGVVRSPFWSDVDAEVAQACESAIRAAGWHVVEVSLENLELMIASVLALLVAETGTFDTGILRSLSPVTRAQLLAGMLVPARYVPRADRVRALIRRSVASIFGSVDLLAWPSTAAPAPMLVEPWVSLPSGRAPVDGSNMRQAVLANLTGVPGISVPVEAHSSGLPIGLQLLAPWGEESRLLDAAEHLEEATSRAFVDVAPPMARN